MKAVKGLILKNGFLFDSQIKKFYKADIKLENGVISQIGEDLFGEDIIDVENRYITPGLVDIHTHGAAGVDAICASVEDLRRMSGFYASKGVTTVFPTTLTAPMETIKCAMKNIVSADEDNIISFRGVHMEGPFLSAKRPGTHTVSLLRGPDIKELALCMELMGERAMYVTVAPELEGSLEFVKAATDMGAKVAIGHSDADGNTVRKALEMGAVNFTHLYNAMKPIHHREPGVVGVGLASDAYCELICDGHHVHPDVVYMTYKTKKDDKLVLVTDSMCAAGMPDGNYILGDVDVTVTDGAARNSDGNLAGSTLNLYDGMLNLMKFAGASFESALICATRNPATVTGIYGKTGSIACGKAADILIINADLSLDTTIAKGKMIYKA